MEWAAFEQVYGPLLIHDRVDIGIAMLAYRLVNMSGKSVRREVPFSKFLPPWIEVPKATHDPYEGFKRMLEQAEAQAAND